MGEARRLFRRGGTMASVMFMAVALGVLVFIAGHGIATYKTWRVRTAWNSTLGTMEEVLKQHPSREANAAALEIERLSAVIGIDTATRSYENRIRPEKGQIPDWSTIQGEMRAYLRLAVSRSSRAVTLPPPIVVDYLHEYREAIGAIRAALLTGDAPLWEQHVEKLHAGTIPNLLGHLDLHRVLLVDALTHAAEGENATALGNLEASWRLSRALDEHPYVITQLIGISALRYQAGVLRHLDRVPPIWRERFRQPDFRRNMIQAVKFEGWIWMQLSADGSTEDFHAPKGILGRAMWAFVGPYYWIGIAQTSESVRLNAEKMDGFGTLCDSSLDRTIDTLRVENPEWNKIGELIYTDWTGAITRLARLELDLEMTRKILELDGRARTSDQAAEGAERSRICPEDQWIYSFGANDSVTLALSREPNWPDSEVGGAQLPSTFNWKR